MPEDDVMRALRVDEAAQPTDMAGFRALLMHGFCNACETTYPAPARPTAKGKKSKFKSLAGGKGVCAVKCLKGPKRKQCEKLVAPTRDTLQQLRLFAPVCGLPRTATAGDWDQDDGATAAATDTFQHKRADLQAAVAGNAAAGNVIDLT